MKKINALITAGLMSLTISQISIAAPSNSTVHFKAPAIAGSGCPGGTTDYAITPDGKSLSILFDNYVADPGNKSCNIAVPVHVPNGFQVSTITADYRGFVEGKAELRRSYFFAGQRTPTKKTKLYSRHGDDYFARDNLLTMSRVWSKCGKDVNMRINSRIRTKSRNSSVSVDSLDLTSGMLFHLEYRRCR